MTFHFVTLHKDLLHYILLGLGVRRERAYNIYAHKAALKVAEYGTAKYWAYYDRLLNVV